jgi:hypothetical protein
MSEYLELFWEVNTRCRKENFKMSIINRLASMIGLGAAMAPVRVSVTPTAFDPPNAGVSHPVPVYPSIAGRKNTTGPTIAILNRSTVVTDIEVTKAIAALQVQVDRDFAPIWELGANLTFVAMNNPIPANAWTIYILDHSDQQGALGYHDLTNTDLPVGKVFAADDKKYNLSWTVTLSHELLEMLLDPYISDSVFVQQTDTTGVLFALEVCDAVEDDSFAYTINGVLVSDFVYPAWFEASRAANSTQFSYGNHVHSPFEIANGGYIGYFEVSSSTTGWQQATGQTGAGQRLLSKVDRETSRIAKRRNLHTLPALNKFKQARREVSPAFSFSLS